VLPGAWSRAVSRRSAALALVVVAPDVTAQDDGAGVEARRYPGVAECVDGGPPGAACTCTECRYHLAHRGYREHHLQPTRDCSLDVANDVRARSTRSPRFSASVASACARSGIGLKTNRRFGPARSSSLHEQSRKQGPTQGSLAAQLAPYQATNASKPEHARNAGQIWSPHSAHHPSDSEDEQRRPMSHSPTSSGNSVADGMGGVLRAAPSAPLRGAVIGYFSVTGSPSLGARRLLPDEGSASQSSSPILQFRRPQAGPSAFGGASSPTPITCSTRRASRLKFAARMVASAKPMQ